MIGLVVAACSKDWCGPGTVELDGQCVAVDEAPPPTIRCGPGTVELDGECVIATAPEIQCGDGTVLRGDECVAAVVQVVRTPLVEGDSAYVMQGAHGYFSHSGAEVYAVDFEVPVGTEIVAARAGKVLDLREDSDAGCADPSCADDGNYVVVDHGDGTFGEY